MRRTSVVRSLACLAILAVCRPAAAIPMEPEAILERVAVRYRSVVSYRADFVQRERIATLGRVRESRGIVFLRRPGRMRWEYSAPDRRLVVSDGHTLWLHYPAERTAYRLALAPQDLEQTPLALLFGEGGGIGEHFRATGAEPVEDGGHRLALQPLRESRELAKLSLLVGPDGTVRGTVIRDAFGNVNEIGLSLPAEGMRLEEGLFTFRPPEGTRILETRGTGP